MFCISYLKKHRKVKMVMNEYELLDKFLKLEFPETHKSFTPSNKEFLIRYSIKKENKSVKIILETLRETTTSESAYYRIYPHVRDAKAQLQYLYHRFISLYRGKKAEECELPPFGKSFISFLEWWLSKTDEKGQRHCYYCGVDEDTALSAFQSVLSSKKFTGRLQIEKKDPDKGYDGNNCEFACVLCNNAKSDLISSDDFKDFFGSAIKQYWEHIKHKTEGLEPK